MPLLVPDGRNLSVPVSAGPSGDDTFERLYLDYDILLRSLAMRRYGVPPDDAEAIVHDAFVAYLQRHTAIREPKTWLMAVVSNLCRHYWRDRKRDEALPTLVPPEIDEVDETDRWEWRITVGAVVARLGEKCRETIRRYYWREESKETIAASLATSPDYVRQLLVSCRRRLKALLHGTGKGAA
jgi:RNA polymerase sigma factor (sigma-70 family)